MSHRDDDRSPELGEARDMDEAVIDFLLGESTLDPARGVDAGGLPDAAAGGDLDAALELAETQLLFERLRAVEAPAGDSDRISLAVRGAIVRRSELRGRRAESRSRGGFGDPRVWLQAGAAAAVFLVGMIGWQRMTPPVPAAVDVVAAASEAAAGAEGVNHVESVIDAPSGAPGSPGHRITSDQERVIPTSTLPKSLDESADSPAFSDLRPRAKARAPGRLGFCDPNS